MCSLASSWLLTDWQDSVASDPEQAPRNWGHFAPKVSKLQGFLGIWSWAEAQELVQIWLSAFWRIRGAKSGLLNLSRSKVYLSVHIPNKHWKGEGWKRRWDVPVISCFLLNPFPHVSAWMLPIQYHPAPTQNSVGTWGRGITEAVGGLGWPGWADVSFFSSHNLCWRWSPPLACPPSGWGMIQSSWVGAPCWGQGLGKWKEEVRGAWDSVADEMGHRGWQQWICIMHLVLQVRLQVAWLVTIPQRQSRSFVLLPSGSNQQPVLPFKCMSQDSKDL